MSQSPNFDDLPMAAHPLDIEEIASWINVLAPLIKYAGSPGDWGYNTKLGVLTLKLIQVRRELTSKPHEVTTP